MFGIALIVFRETLEAALFIGIIAAATRDLPGRGRWLGAGVVAGLAGSLLLAAMAARIGELADGIGQDLVNAGILLLAFAMLGWHIIWSARHGMQAAGAARQLGQTAAEGGALRVLALAVAMSVLREGAETVLFVGGYLVGSGAQQIGSAQALSGLAVGVAAGAGVGGILYFGLSRIPLRRLFAVTNVLILLLAAAMAGQLGRVLVQAGVLESFTEPVWNTSELLPMDSAFGALLHALVGYDAQPFGMQLIFYTAGLLLIVAGMRAVRPRPPAVAR